jgi:hypothetical protein
MCAPTNIYLDYARNTCVGKVATATRVHTGSYFGTHLHTSLSHLLFYLFTLRFQLPALYYDFLFHTLCILFILSLLPTLHFQSLRSLCSFHFEAPTHYKNQIT